MWYKERLSLCREGMSGWIDGWVKHRTFTWETGVCFPYEAKLFETQTIISSFFPVILTYGTIITGNAKLPWLEPVASGSFAYQSAEP